MLHHHPYNTRSRSTASAQQDYRRAAGSPRFPTNWYKLGKLTTKIGGNTTDFLPVCQLIKAVLKMKLQLSFRLILRSSYSSNGTFKNIQESRSHQRRILILSHHPTKNFSNQSRNTNVMAITQWKAPSLIHPSSKVPDRQRQLLLPETPLLPTRNPKPISPLPTRWTSTTTNHHDYAFIGHK